MTRRSFIPSVAGAASLGSASTAAAAEQPIKRKGRLKQAATRGCFARDFSIEDQCREAVRLGLKGLDLVREPDWPILKKYGLVAVMVSGGGGINHKENHEKAAPRLIENIGKAADAGWPNVIVTFQERQGLSYEEGMDNSVRLLRSGVMKVAEDKGVNVCMEVFNSKVNHPDAQADSTKWTVDVCKRVDSPRIKILYDIYHMQIMEGDIIRTIRENIYYIGHFHTAGVPGRHEIDDTQELNYRAIAQAIVDLGYEGYLGHEYTPLRDPLESLDQAITICDV
jgi:hydroxypyruvate isomerase